MATPQEAITWWAVVSAFGGSIIGGTISAAVSLFIQKKNLAAAKQDREEERFQSKKALAFALFLKMVRIHSTIVLLHKDIVENLERAEKDGVKGDLWQKIIPHGNLPPHVKFVPEEIALLLSLDVQLFNDLGPYDDIHNSLLDLFSIYAQKRSAMMEKFGASMRGSIGTTGLTKEEHDWLAPRAYEVTQLADTMLKRAAHDSTESRELLVRLHSLFVKEFGLIPKLEFKVS